MNHHLFLNCFSAFPINIIIINWALFLPVKLVLNQLHVQITFSLKDAVTAFCYRTFNNFHSASRPEITHYTHYKNLHISPTRAETSRSRTAQKINQWDIGTSSWWCIPKLNNFKWWHLYLCGDSTRIGREETLYRARTSNAL